MPTSCIEEIEEVIKKNQQCLRTCFKSHLSIVTHYPKIKNL